MDKYSEEKEGNQWDDDFIFDSVPLPVRKRGTSTSTAITSHLSTSSAVQKDKRKSNSTWNNAFKKIEADPRHIRTTSSVSSGKSSAVSTSSNTKNIIQSHSSTPHSMGGGEFAFFDSDDCVGYGKATGSRQSPWPSNGSQKGPGVSLLPPRNTISNGLPPTPPPAATSHLTKQSSGRTQDTADNMEFDDGLGEGNLGFNDDDYIPNVGFDDFDDFPTPSQSQPSSSLSQSTPSRSQPVQHSTTASMSSNLSSSLRNSSSDSGSRVHPAPYGMQLHRSGDPYRQRVPSLRLNSTSSDLLASSSSIVGEQLLEEILENDEPLSFDVVGTLTSASAGDSMSLVGSTAGLRNPHAYTHDGSASGSNYVGVPQLHRSGSGTSSMLASRSLGQRQPSNPLTAARISSYGYLAALSLSDDSPRAGTSAGTSAGTTPAGSAIRAPSTTTPAGSRVNSPYRSSLRSPGACSEGGVEPSPTVSVKERILQYERREYINESPASEDSDSSDSIKTTEKRVSNNTALTGVGTSGSHGHHRHEDHECSDHSYASFYSRSHSGQYSSRSYSSYDHSHSGSGSHTDSITGSESDLDSVSEFDSQDSAELTESKEDIEEGDWDLDLEPPTKASALHSAQTFKDIITGRVGGTQGAVNTAEEDAPETERESLLDFLKSTVQRTIIPTPKSQLGSPAEMEAAARELLERSYDSADGDGAGMPLGARVDASMGRSTAHSVSTPSLSSRDYNMEAYEEEGHNVETANPHLRGLLSWVDTTTQCFNTVLTTANSSTTHNARTLLHTEVDLPGGDELYMEKLLERCEQLPSSSSSIPTLEIVSKWLRAICNLYDKIIGSLHYSSSNEQEHCDYDMRSSSHSTSAPPKVRRTASLGEAKLNQFSHTQSNNEGNNKNDSIFFGELSGRRIAHIYDYCDSILQEQLFSTTTALGTNYRKLLSTNTTSTTTKNSTYNTDRNSTYNKDRNSTYNKDRNSTYNADRNSTYNTDHNSDTEWCTQNNTTATTNKDNWLVNMGMVAVKDPAHYDDNNTQQLLQLRCISAPSDDDMLITDTVRLSSNLISLYRLQINMLEIRIHMYDGFELVACLELLQKISEELEKVSNTLFTALRRALPVKERCTAEQIAQLVHLDELNTVANDLLGCCFSIKVFAICCVSPINFQNLPEHCQHINQNGPEIAKVGTYDGSLNSEDGYPTLGIATTTATAAGNRISNTKKITKTYNVIYELTLGTHFLEVMLTLSTPSVVRSKIYLGVYTYLQRLKKKQLPWQNRHFKLISLKQQLDSFANVFNLYQGADTFGLNYADMDNNTFTLSLAEVEGSIVQSFAEVFGSLDQHRIDQLLLFESANELLPSVAREETKGPAAYLRRHPPAQSQDTQPVQNADQSYNKDGDRGESDLSDLNHRSSSKQPWGVFTSMRSAFRHLSVALNLDTSLTWGKRRSEPSHTGGTTGTTTSTTHHLYLLNNAPTRPKLKGGLSYNARYELFYFSNHVLYRLAQAIIEMSPNIALDVLQLCILLLGHLRHPKERARVEKIAVMLAVKVGRRDAAIWHGEAVLRNLQLQGDNVNEMLYMTDLLAAQYSENAQYELAAKALFSAISALNNRNKGGTSLQPGSPMQSQRRNRNSSEKDRTRSMSSLAPDDSAAVMEFERTLDPLLLKLGKLLLHFGCPDRAADTFQVLLSSLCERTDCLANDAKKVTVLSWLAEAYLELEDYSTCSSVIKAIKAVRGLKLHKVTRAVRLERASKRIAGRDTTTTGSIKLSRKNSKSKSLTPPISLSRSMSGKFNRNNSKHFFADHSPSSSSRNGAQLSTTSLLDPETRPATLPVVVGENISSADSVTAAVVPVVQQHHRGIAVQSTDSFDFDTNDVDVLRENSIDKIPLYTNPKDNSSSNVQDSDALRWRPLPDTPKSTAPMAPRWTPEAHLSSPSSGQRKSKLLRKRPPPLAPLDSLEQMRMHSSDASITEVKDSFDGLDNTPPVQGSEDCDTIPTPSSSSKVPVGLKRSLSKRKRKSRQLNNLQALHVSNSNNNLNGVSPQNTSRSDRTKENEPGNAVSTGGGGIGNTATPAHPLPPPTPFPSTITGSIASNRNSGIPTAAAVSSIYLHYLRNPPEANLPQFCATVEDLDLGSLKARLHYKNKKYAEALKFLLPTLIGVELMVIGTSQRIVSKGGTKHETQQQPFWSRQALLELGDLYYLRGKIQLEAAKSCSDVTYPLQVGSKDLFERVQSALAVSTPTTPSTTTAATCMSPRLNTTASDTPRAGTALQYGAERRFCKNTRSKRTRRDGSTPVPTNAATGASPNSFFKKDTHTDTMPTSDALNMTCREPKLYETPADMCWDALQWFHRAKDVARIAGDEIGGALAANALASCHLLPAFAPHALFKVPLDKTLDLSSTTTATTTPPPSLNESKVTVAGEGVSKKASLREVKQEGVGKKASLREVQHSMEWALEVHSQSCLPLPLMDAYMNLAEMCELLGNAADGLAFWAETKELFMHLFADGTLIPLVRRASAGFVRKLQSILSRIVRFMWTLDKVAVNSCLYLLDIQVLLQLETQRMIHRNTIRAQCVSSWLPDVLVRILHPDGPADPIWEQQQQQQLQQRKRSTISRVSRFFTRLFANPAMSAQPALSSTHTREPLSASPRNSTHNHYNHKQSPVSNRISGRYSSSSSNSNRDRHSSRQHTPDHHAHSPNTTSTVGVGGNNKGSNSFDGFIERSGFSTQLDMRRFYNIMNAELVAEKVFSFGWSHSVEYDQLLKPVLRDSNNSSNSEVVEQYRSSGLKDRPNSISSVATAQPAFNSGKLSPRSAHSVNGVEALIVLNLRSKLDFAAKYRSILPATYLQEHILTRTMFTTTEVDGEDEIDSVFGGSNKDFSPVPAAPIATLARSNSLLGLSPRSGRGIKRTPSSCIGEQSCDHLTPLTSSALDVKGSEPSELPLDPFSDFDWMDESFADYTPYSRSLQARAVYDRQHSCSGTNTTSRSRYKRGMLGAESAQFPAMFMPEFDEAHAFSAQEVQNSQSKHHHRAESGSSGTVAWEQGDTQLSGGGSTNPSALLSSEFTAEYLRSLDERAETILIQRVWRCYMLVQNARKGYRSGQRSMGLLRHDVRSALSSLCLNMVRLRAFSRQYQPSLLDFERLQEDLSKLPASLTSQGQTSLIEKTVDINTEEQELLLRYQNGMLSAEEVHTLRRSLKERRRKQPVLLQHRLPFLVYTIHIEDCLLLYRPHDGTRAVQKLGGSGFLTLTGSHIQGSEQTDTVTVSSAPHSTTTATPPPPPPPPLGIAEKSKHETRKLEQKSSLFSMLSFMSAGSDVTRDSSLHSHAQTGKQNKKVGNSFFFRPSSWLMGSSPRTPSSGGVFFPSDQSSSDISCATDSRYIHTNNSSSYTNNTNNTTRNNTTTSAAVNVQARDALLEGSDVSSNSAIGTASAEHSDVPTISCAPPILRQCDTKLLFDLTVGVEDQQCGGGKEGRRTILTEMCAHVSALSPSLQFIQAVGESNSKPRLLESDIQYGDKVTSSLNSSVLGAAASGKQSAAPSNAAIAALRGEKEDTSIAPSSMIGLSSSMSNILGLFSSSDSVEATQRQWKQGTEDDEGAPHRAPCKEVPLTLICTPSVAVLPWELLLIKSKVCVVRQVGLIALCAQVLSSQHWLLQSHSDNPAPRRSITTANAVVGPRRHQKAALVVVDYSTTELSVVSVQSSCTRVATSCITALGHSTTHLHTGIDNADVGEGNTITSLQGQHTSRSPLACSLDARVLPLPSQLFKQSTHSSSFLGKSEILLAGSDMKLNDSHRPVQLQDFWKCLPARPPPTLQRRGKSVVDITALYGHFPLLILSYTDYVALSDAVAWVISSQPEAVMVFAPTFLHEPLCIELKLCLDRWCKPDISVSPPRSPVSQGSRSHAHSAGTGTRTESSITMPGAYARSRSEGSSSVLMFSGFRSMGSSGSTTDRPESSEHTPHSRPGSRSTTGGFGTFLSKTAASLLPGRSTASTGSSQQQQQLDTSFEATQLQQQHSTNSSRFGSGGLSTKAPPLPVIAEERAKRSPTARSRDGGVQVGHGAYSTTGAVHQSHSSNDIETTESLHLTDRTHMSLDGNRGSTSQTAKALRGKERTWIYHAVMSVVQSMQEEHQVPIVVFA